MTITNGLTTKTQLKLGVKTQNIPIGVEFEALMDQTVSFSRADHNSYSATKEHDETIPYIVPAQTWVKGSVTISQSKTDVPFTATATFDADVHLEWQDSDAAFPNHWKIIRKLSWLLPNPSDRTFAVSGNVHGANINSSDAVLYQKKLTAKDCPFHEKLLRQSNQGS